MTFIPSVLSKVDPNNTFTDVSGTIYTGSPTEMTGYNYIILSIKANNTNTIINGIKIYMYDQGETPSAYYSDNYVSNTIYERSFKITKKYYYVNCTFNSVPTTINITSRLSTSNQPDTIANNSSTFDYSSEYSLDAFGKLRVSNPFTLIDIKFVGQMTGSNDFLDNNLIVCFDSSGNYSSDASGNGYLTINGQGYGHCISQSRKFCTYQPGKSLLIMMSGVIVPEDNSGNYVNGFTGRIGYYTNNPNYNLDNTIIYNGLLYQYDSSGCSINHYNNGNLINKYFQSQWNLDTMDGLGPSRINLNFFKTQLMMIDLEWLGVGRIRFGFFAYGRIHYCHQITNINILTSPYISNINLPIRYELIGTGANSASIKQICSTVISEGGYSPIGRPFGISSTSGISVDNTEKAIIGLKGGTSNYFHQNIIPTDFNIVDSTTNNTNLWRMRLYLGSNTLDVSGNWLAVDSTYSTSQYATSLTGWNTTNSIILAQGLFSGRGTISFGDLTSVFTDLVLHITSTPNLISDIIVLTCQRVNGSSNSNVFVSMNIVEAY
jgi:hypothetical protein